MKNIVIKLAFIVFFIVLIVIYIGKADIAGRGNKFVIYENSELENSLDTIYDFFELITNKDLKGIFNILSAECKEKEFNDSYDEFYKQMNDRLYFTDSPTYSYDEVMTDKNEENNLTDLIYRINIKSYYDVSKSKFFTFVIKKDNDSYLKNYYYISLK